MSRGEKTISTAPTKRANAVRIKAAKHDKIRLVKIFATFQAPQAASRVDEVLCAHDFLGLPSSILMPSFMQSSRV
jgi:hypothetical protein